MPSFAKSLSLHLDIQPFAEYAVTPFVGVWIETRSTVKQGVRAMSHPSWVCGLKQASLDKLCDGLNVTPFVGVWIETERDRRCDGREWSHTLRGCVD